MSREPLGPAGGLETGIDGAEDFVPDLLEPEDEPLVSVVIPFFNEQGNVGRLVERIEGSLEVPFELILVDDGSQDGTWQRIESIAAEKPGLAGISLTRNFGHQNALFAGLQQACGRAVITMDGDLQHPPELLPELVREWRGGFQVVNTRRIDSEDTPRFKRATSRWFYALFSKLTGVPMSQGSSDFRLLDREVVDALLQMRETDLFLRGIVSWLGYPSTSVRYRAENRHWGRSKFGIARMLSFSTGALLSFSMLPLKIGIWIGFLTSIVALAEIAYILIRFFQGQTVPGWASIMVVLSLGFAVLFVLLGIIGSYLGRVYEVLKQRPYFVVKETVGGRAPTLTGPIGIRSMQRAPSGESSKP